MKMKSKWILGALLAASLVIAGCGGQSAEKEAVLKVGTNATYVPFEFKNDKDEYAGFDMELAQQIAERLHRKLEIRNIAFDGLIPAMLTGELDMIASGMVVTPERAQKVDFIPYYQAGLGILLNPNVEGVHQKNDLQGKKFAVQMGTTGAVAAHSIPGAQIVEFDHNSDALLELRKGSVDAVICSIPVAKHYIKTTTDHHAKLVKDPIEAQTLGLAFNKNNTQLKQEVEKVLLEMKKDGTYEALQKKWFGDVQK